MYFSFTNKQKRIIRIAEEVSESSLESRAAHYDELAIHPVESWRDVWESGLLAMTIPEDYGGIGLDMLTYIMAIEKLAHGCTNTAMTVHMHSVVQRYIDVLGSPKQKARFYPEVVDEGKLFGSWGSEPGRRGGSGVAKTTISPVEKGFEINGEKHFCTMAGGAYRYMVHCTMSTDSKDEGILMALVPCGASGLEITGNWNTLGMRATVSPSVSFKQCTVDTEEVLGIPGLSEKVGVGQGFGLGYAAVYIGAAQASLDFLIQHAKTQRYDPDTSKLSHSLIIQRGVAHMMLELDSARLLMYQSAALWEDNTDPITRAVLAARAKYMASRVAVSVTSAVIQLGGGRVAHRRYPFERIYRDVRTCTLMPPNDDRSLEIVGKAELGIDDDLLMLRHS